jgi:hypothetical protein
MERKNLKTARWKKVLTSRIYILKTQQQKHKTTNLENMQKAWRRHFTKEVIKMAKTT